MAVAATENLEHAGLLNDVCLLYTSDAADERSSVDLGGRRIIKKKKLINNEFIICLLINTAQPKIYRHTRMKKRD